MHARVNPNITLRNHLLAILPAGEFLRLEPKLELVSLKFGDVLYESDDKMDYVYFPTTAIIVMLCIMEDGATAQVGKVGNDGLIGVSLFMGDDTTMSRVEVLSSGTAIRMKAEDLKAEFARGDVFQQILLRYTQTLITQIAQIAVCNRLHSIQQQLCRCLLLIHDRLDSDNLVITHDLIAHMIGVRREGVTLAVGKLAKKKLITNGRGAVAIIDRQGLEAATCECYKVINDEYNRLLGRDSSRTFK